MMTTFTVAYCRTQSNGDGCGWSRRYDGEDPAEHSKVLAAARRHAGGDHVVHAERGAIEIYGREAGY